jgi:hypothetical protein
MIAGMLAGKRTKEVPYIGFEGGAAPCGCGSIARFRLPPGRARLSTKPDPR